MRVTQFSRLLAHLPIEQLIHVAQEIAVLLEPDEIACRITSSAGSIGLARSLPPRSRDRADAIPGHRSTVTITIGRWAVCGFAFAGAARRFESIHAGRDKVEHDQTGPAFTCNGQSFKTAVRKWLVTGLCRSIETKLQDTFLTISTTSTSACNPVCNVPGRHRCRSSDGFIMRHEPPVSALRVKVLFGVMAQHCCQYRTIPIFLRFAVSRDEVDGP